MRWAVDFFVDERGRAPAEEFLSALPISQRAKALAIIKMLEHEGPNLPFPYSSQVRGKLRELRTQQGRDKLRILYFGDAKSLHSSARHRQANGQADRGRHWNSRSEDAA